MNVKTLFVLFLLFCSIIILTSNRQTYAFGQVQHTTTSVVTTGVTPNATKQVMSKLISNLESNNRTVRMNAFSSVLALMGERDAVMRDAAVSDLITILNKNKAVKTSDEGSTIHLAITLLGESRDVKAIDPLIDTIDFSIKLKAGAKYAPGYAYTAANALINIGGTEVLDAVIARIGEESSLTNRQLLTWVVYRLVGIDRGMKYLESASTNLNINQKQRLLDARTMIEAGNGLVLR